MKYLRVWQASLLVAVFVVWHLLTTPGLLPNFMFENDRQAAFFFGEPVKIFGRIWTWFVVNADIYQHLWVTLLETVLAFAIGTLLGLGFGLWLALSPMAGAIADPYIKALNSMPRVILAPIFAVWFGLGIASKVALGVTLVFFIVFFNVYQGVKEVSPVVLANARMLGASQRQLLRHVYLPSATSWVFSSLHTSVGLAFVGAVVGEYLGSSRGVGYLILQAEGAFDINTVMAGHPRPDRLRAPPRRRRRPDRAAPDALAAGGRRDREALTASMAQTVSSELAQTYRQIEALAHADEVPAAAPSAAADARRVGEPRPGAAAVRARPHPLAVARRRARRRRLDARPRLRARKGRQRTADRLRARRCACAAHRRAGAPAPPRAPGAVVHAGLQETRLAGEAWQWYGPEIEETLVGQRARLVFIDGPPGSLQPLARYPARRRLAPFLADDAVIVLDDVARPDEWAITERWLRDDPRLTLQRIAHEKGTAILSRSR